MSSLQMYCNIGGFYKSIRHINYLRNEFHAFQLLQQGFFNKVSTLTVYICYCAMLQDCKMSSAGNVHIHLGQSLGSSIKTRHHTCIAQTKESQDIAFFRDTLDFLLQHPQFSILLRMFKTPNCGSVGTMQLWCQRCGC